MKVSDYTQSALLNMLITLIDAHYGTSIHHIGDSDGIPEKEAAEIREFWTAYLEEIIDAYKAKKGS